MTGQTIQVTIVGDSRGIKCDAECGTDWSKADALDLARQRIKDRFDRKIDLKYIDLSKAAANHDAIEWDQAIKEKNLSLPVLLINGQPRISGEFDTRQLLDAIEAEMEIAG